MIGSNESLLIRVLNVTNILGKEMKRNGEKNHSSNAEPKFALLIFVNYHYC